MRHEESHERDQTETHSTTKARIGRVAFGLRVVLAGVLVSCSIHINAQDSRPVDGASDTRARFIRREIRITMASPDGERPRMCSIALTDDPVLRRSLTYTVECNDEPTVVQIEADAHALRYVVAWADGFAPLIVDRRNEDGALLDDLRFELARGASLVCRIVDSDGSPLEGARVQLVPREVRSGLHRPIYASRNPVRYICTTGYVSDWDSIRTRDYIRVGPDDVPKLIDLVTSSVDSDGRCRLASIAAGEYEAWILGPFTRSPVRLDRIVVVTRPENIIDLGCIEYAGCGRLRLRLEEDDLARLRGRRLTLREHDQLGSARNTPCEFESDAFVDVAAQTAEFRDVSPAFYDLYLDDERIDGRVIMIGGGDDLKMSVRLVTWREKNPSLQLDR